MELASFIGGKALTTTLAIAEGTNNQHKNVLELTRKYAKSLERVGGAVAFETRGIETTGGIRNQEVAYLNERQSTMLINLMRNNDVVIAFKERLTTAFYELAEKKPVIDYSDPIFIANLITQGAVRVQELEHDNQALAIENQGLAVEKQALALENHQLRPGAVFAAQVAAAPDSISVGDTAKLIGTGRNRLMAFMRRMKWINRYNAPYQEKIEEGLMDSKAGGYQRPDKGLGQSITPIVTGKGLIELQRLWEEDQAAATAIINHQSDDCTSIPY